jgi:hypothetical protein
MRQARDESTDKVELKVECTQLQSAADAPKKENAAMSS